MHRATVLLAVSLAACGAASEMATNTADYSKAKAPSSESFDGSLLTRGADAGAIPDGPKLIRTGSLSVVVDSFEPFERDLKLWLTSAGGFIADANLTHREGEVGWASLTLRVPAASFEPLVGWAQETVEVESLNLSTADVTARWVDVQARIDNGLRTERRLQTLLAESTGDLSDVLAVERELSRVRGEVEAAEGQMRVLADQVGFSTLDLQVRVKEIYEPIVGQSFGDDVNEVFAGSIGAMVSTGRAAALVGVGLAPWLVVLVGAPALMIVGVRRRRTVA